MSRHVTASVLAHTSFCQNGGLLVSLNRFSNQNIYFTAFTVILYIAPVVKFHLEFDLCMYEVWAGNSYQIAGKFPQYSPVVTIIHLNVCLKLAYEVKRYSGNPFIRTAPRFSYSKMKGEMESNNGSMMMMIII